MDVPCELVLNENDKKCCQRKPNEMCRIWTRKFEKVNPSLQNGHQNVEQDSLVMIHGLGAGGALFALNFDGLSKHFTVYCLDLPGTFILPGQHRIRVYGYKSNYYPVEPSNGLQIKTKHLNHYYRLCEKFSV